MTFFPLPAPRAIQALLLAATLALAGLTSPLQADSPFLRGSTGATKAGANAANAGTDAAIDNADPDEPAALALGPRTVTVAPGANAILELAIDHLNRIVTPFERPSVRTVSELSTEVEGNVVYIATASEVPATLYISAGDASRTTVALTLAPRRVPPREIRLLVPGYQPARPKTQAKTAADAQAESTPVVLSPTHPARWQQPLPYLQTLTTTLRDLARGETPEGFRRRSARSDDRLRCEVSGLRVSDLEIQESEQLTLLKARLRYSGKEPLGITPHHCRPRGTAVIAAQATWPRTELRQGEETILLLALRAAESDRPFPGPGLTARASDQSEARP